MNSNAKRALAIFLALILGFAGTDKAEKIDWALCGKGALLALCMLAMMYVLVAVCEAVFLLDFRFIWPFFKTFTGERFGQFLIYVPFFALFFLLNNSKIFADMCDTFGKIGRSGALFAKNSDCAGDFLKRWEKKTAVLFESGWI